MKKIYLIAIYLLCFTPLLATASSFAQKIQAATFKIYHPKSTSTCFIVKTENKEQGYFLVTTAHTLERTDGTDATLVLRKELDNGDFERVNFKIQIRKDGKPLWKQHKSHDIAVLELPVKLPTSVEALPISNLATTENLKLEKVNVCSTIFSFSYPERFEANAAGFPLARQGIISSPLLLPIEKYTTFLADLKTFSGDSGGPVFIPAEKGDKPLILGIVIKRHFHKEKIVTEYGEAMRHHPFNIAEVLHAIYVTETILQ